jgi:glycine oxidase
MRVAVIGGGVIGLAVALDLRRRGVVVCVYEQGDEPGAGASSRAAGMLGAGYESAVEAPPVADLAHLAAGLWPGFAADIMRLGGDFDLRTEGALAVAEPSDIARIDAMEAACNARGVACRRLTPTEARAFEPALTADMAALHLPGDGQVDAGLLIDRLARAATAAGAEIRFGRPVDAVACSNRFATPDGARWDAVILATGVSDGGLRFQTPSGDRLDPQLGPIVPVKGQMLALQARVGAPACVIRAPGVYIAPKDRWTLIGATSEPGKADTETDRDALDGLREAATRLAGGLALAGEVRAWAGVRPGTADGAPMIGETAIPGVFAALGCYRNGVLLAPAVAATLSTLIIDGKVSDAAAAFSPRRFDNRSASRHSP